jgi:mannose-1-phosphate guanylyltransferase
VLHAVILAGGRGERFWPLSRSGRAKQFLSLLGPETLLARTAARLRPLVPLERTIVVTGRDQEPLVRESLSDAAPVRILGEPKGRNTAPAVALGALAAGRNDPDAVLLVVPSDAWVGDDAAYRAALETAARHAAASEALGTIGIVPSRPETGYGYLELGAPIDATPGLHVVDRFVEKPDAATAAAYLAGGRHLWNGGIFVMRVAAFRSALERHLPEVAGPLAALEADGTLDAAALDRFYAAVPSISIDYGVMERAEQVFTVRGAFPWDDLGSWSALARVLPAPDGVHERGETLALDSEGAILYSEGSLVAVLGLPGVIVVQTPDAVLALPAERAQEVRRIVEALRTRPGGERWL